ncbi:MAG: sugar phosphate isomerase/epimerase family protein [Coriobacteriaceae bacterium]|nr:sugar phosphate isomerase/epimerase family protein [Coriobacteriaceae bacterium]
MVDRIPQLAAMNCHHRFYSLESFFKSSRSNGYDCVELWTGPQHFFMDYASNDSVERLAALARLCGVRIIGICPEQTNPKPNNMAACSAEAQRRTFSYFSRAIDVACAVGVQQVVLTGGWAFLDEDASAAYERSVSMLRRLADYAEARDMLLAVEALQPGESVLLNSAADLKRLLNDVDRPVLKACLDTGAMARAGDTIERYFETLGTDIVHAHFVDVDMDVMDTHLAWGDGTRDMASDVRAFVQAGYQGVLSVETVSSRYHAHPDEADRQSMECYRAVVSSLG